MTPYEIPPMAGVAVLGVPIVVEVDYPNRNVISKIIIVQTAGPLEAFTVALFNHPQVLTGEVTSDSAGPEVGRIPDDCYRVTPDLVAANGKLLYFADQASGGYGYLFFSHKTPFDRQGQGTRKLYVRITPVGGGAKLFSICIGGQQSV